MKFSYEGKIPRPIRGWNRPLSGVLETEKDWALCEASNILSLDDWSDKKLLKELLVKYQAAIQIMNETNDEADVKHEEAMVTFKNDGLDVRHAKRRAMQYQDELVRDEKTGKAAMIFMYHHPGRPNGGV